jgi:hypothetical protein
MQQTLIAVTIGGLAAGVFAYSGTLTADRFKERKENLIKQARLRDPSLSQPECDEAVRGIIRVVNKMHIDSVYDSDWRLDFEDCEVLFENNPRKARMIIPYSPTDNKADPEDVVRALATDKPTDLAYEIVDGNLKRALVRWRVMETVESVEQKCGKIYTKGDWERCSAIRRYFF